MLKCRYIFIQNDNAYNVTQSSKRDPFDLLWFLTIEMNVVIRQKHLQFRKLSAFFDGLNDCLHFGFYVISEYVRCLLIHKVISSAAFNLYLVLQLENFLPFCSCQRASFRFISRKRATVLQLGSLILFYILVP